MSFPCKNGDFRYVSHYQKVKPTFSHGCLMVFLWFSHFPVGFPCFFSMIYQRVQLVRANGPKLGDFAISHCRLDFWVSAPDFPTWQVPHGKAVIIDPGKGGICPCGFHKVPQVLVGFVDDAIKMDDWGYPHDTGNLHIICQLWGIPFVMLGWMQLCNPYFNSNRSIKKCRKHSHGLRKLSTESICPMSERFISGLVMLF